MKKALSRSAMLLLTLSMLISLSGCFHHHKHVRHKPAPEGSRTQKIQYLPRWLSPARKVSAPNRVYTYQYYPKVNIYYDTTRNLYFFTDGEDWQEASTLPSHVHINQDEGVTIKLKSDKPFLSEISRSYTDTITW